MDKREIERQIEEVMAKIDEIARRIHAIANIHQTPVPHPELAIEDLKREKAELSKELERLLKERCGIP